MPFFPQFSSLFVPPYVPPPPAAPIAWYKADVGVTYDGSDLVSAWADQSGNSYDATVYDAGYEPLYVPNHYNSLPWIYFNPDLSNDEKKLLITPAILPLNYDTPFTAIGVINANYTDLTQGGDAHRWLLQNGDSGDWLAGFDFGPYQDSEFFGSMFGKNLIGETNITGTEIESGQDLFAIVSITNNGSQIEFFENGVSKGTGDPNDYSDATLNTGEFTIGAQLGGGTVYLGAKFYLGELLIFDSALSSVERESFENDLNTKWDIF